MLESEGIDLDVVEDRASVTNSDYWSSCFKFLDDVQDKEYDKLSPKQRDWVDSIVRDMIEYTA